jgi:hypothetical protein
MTGEFDYHAGHVHRIQPLAAREPPKKKSNEINDAASISAGLQVRARSRA